MNYRDQIDSTFDGNAFKRPLFYGYGGGLRFELSEGGNYLNQFLTAHRKGMEICSEIFRPDKPLTVCFKVFGESLLSCRSVLRGLIELEIYPKQSKEYWTEREEEWEGDEDYSNCHWHYFVFDIPPDRLLNVLWCAFSSDFGPIKPRAHATVYLFNLEERIMALAYDDRGMDVVGPNRPLLKKLYDRFNAYLLSCDKEAMDASFSEID
ncbi:DUF3885 domain-containing protein [Adhaeretor mobilis]|uniref:DUF3885 domain-containing protein n=1 Tax=Adhaeretor mobilis TaxID=1930276 RepID=A0A517MR06_9BACT|nr:DUF3885 domain-containing protein [Adhaeretor mobilis]QDS97309.1 hypothetical protein HG15A2_05700 [Adhaeretor mobilis]